MENLPSTTKRQSCDRCYKQKLRCQRPADDSSGACERCIRLKTQCVYSSSLPKGRPSRQKKNDPCTSKPYTGNTQTECNSEADGHFPAIVAEGNTTEKQQFDRTGADSCIDAMSMDWLDYVDHNFTNPEQWHFDPQELDIENENLSDNTLNSSSVVSPDLFSGETPELNHQHIPPREDFHQNTTTKTLKAETPMAGLSRLSQHICSLHSAVLDIANSPDALDQKDTPTLQKGPFADDSAFQKLTGWLVRASSNIVDPSISTSEQDKSIPPAAQDGCALLQNVFSASQDLLDALQALNEGATRSDLPPQPSEGSLPILSSTDSMSTTPEDKSSRALPGSVHYQSVSDWSSSIIRHMIMANHMLLLNTYLAAIMALQHAVNKQRASLSTPDARQYALPLGEMRTAMVAQMCGYLIQRQVNAVQMYLASPPGSVLSEQDPSDQTTMKQLEVDVQERLARLSRSLPV